MFSPLRSINAICLAPMRLNSRQRLSTEMKCWRLTAQCAPFGRPFLSI